MHDDTVDRTTNGTGLVRNMTYDQIRALIVDGGTNASKYPNLKVPTLDEYLIVCRKFNLVPVIEIKAANNDTDYDSFVDLIKRHGFEEKCIVISFSTTAIQNVRNRSKRIMVQPLIAINVDNLNFIKTLGNASIDVFEGQLTKELIDLAHSHGVLVNTWTVNSYSRAKDLADMGIDFITTDIIPEVVL